jgi:hypothetical protein
MKWAIAAAALVVVANGLVLVPVQRERSAPVSRTTIHVCPEQVHGGGEADEPPAVRLRLRPDAGPTPAGLDSAGLRALGFSERAVAGVGKARDSTFRWGRGRPAWVRLREATDSLGTLMVVEVAARREQLVPDSSSFRMRGIVALRERWSEATPADTSGPEPHRPVPGDGRGVVYPVVAQLMPGELHLDRQQIVAVRSAFGGSGVCAPPAPLQIANGAGGGVWVVGVR